MSLAQQQEETTSSNKKSLFDETQQSCSISSNYYFGTSTPSANSSTDLLLERTIAAMQGVDGDLSNSSSDGGGICAHPLHLHSFQQVNFLLSMRNCAGCHARIQTTVVNVFGGRGGSGDSAKQVVRCLACGVYAHRKCAMNVQLAQTLWKPEQICCVNRDKIQEIMLTQQEQQKNPSSSSSSSRNNNNSNQQRHELYKNQQLASSSEDDETDRVLVSSPNINGNKEMTSDNEEVVEFSEATTMEWTTDGPPEHWSKVSGKSPQPCMSGSPSTSCSSSPSVVERPPSADDDEEDDVVNVENDAPLHYASHPFASVSRALQENILAHFQYNNNSTNTNIQDTNKGYQLLNSQEEDNSKNDYAIKSGTKSLTSPEEENKNHNPVIQFVGGAVNAVRTTVAIPGRMGTAAVAGGIAGGVAGLAIAGPAGVLAGYQFGKTAGALGVLLEGSVSVGVFVASVATGSAAGKHIHEHLEERRVLEMGERGASRTVLLVRPNIKIDESWGKICAQAAAKAPRRQGTLSFLQSDASRERHRRDNDIVQQTEDEIPTNDKVFLLVNRILNDKESLPGHVYRSLIATFFERIQNRKELQDEGYADSENSNRNCRDDTHAMIKFVTATLLEVKPGLDASPSITELTATAVEALVFGKVYDQVLEEIAEEVAEKDAALLEKCEQCEQDSNIHDIVSGNISEKALRALQRIPTAHSAADKLEDCVRFLESISEHFATSGGSQESLCADSLLKMVCQHVLMAKVSRLNAEITFLEEFARDEQLLRGREGYSLVTLQAALHFLNMCSNIESDIFGQDDEEENIPLTNSSDLDESVEII